MSKPQKQERAMAIRMKGHSINYIATTLQVSKSTVSLWCRDIAMTDKQIELIAKRSHHQATFNLLKASEKQREKRQESIRHAIKLGEADVGQLSKRDIHMIGLGLYWGEGYKKGNQELGFTNSDPQMILFYIHWLDTLYDVQKSDLVLRVSINSQHKERVRKVLEYWSNITQISLSQFTKTSLIKSTRKKIYTNLDSHFGTLRVKVRKGTQLRRRILGSLSFLKVK